MGIFRKLFGKRSAAEQPPARPTGSYRQQKIETKDQAARPANDAIDLDPHLHGRIESIGPGKNVYVRSQYVREDTGTHETLKIVDESILQAENEDGFDPYNTGRFDRSKHWNTRTRK